MTSVAATTFALRVFVVLAAAQFANVTTVGWPAAGDVPGWFGQDAAVALLAAAAATLAARRSRRAPAVLFALVALYAALGVAFVSVLGSPPTAPMLRGLDAAMGDSVAAHLTFAALALPCAVLVVAACAWRTLHVSRNGALAMLGAIAALGIGVGAARSPAHRNAAWTFARSLGDRYGAEASTSTFRPSRAATLERGLGGLRGAGRGRDVVVVVLESVAPRFLAPYGAAADPMPFVTRLGARGIRCDNAYAVYPESIKGQIALFHAVHPAPGTSAEDYAAIPVPALATLLTDAGYATALFHSGRFRFLGMAAVLTRSGFAHRADAAVIGGEVESSFGVDEESTVDALLRWVDAQPPSRPFCAAYLPVAGHHPYAHPGGPFADDSMLGSYRNAIHYADRAIARLWRGLEARGRAERTLLCIVGDHGQAFGEHAGNFGHTFFVYDENVRVPLWFVAPGLTDRAGPIVVDRVVSHVDVVPTLLDILGIEPHPSHEGVSLLDPSERPALFFADWGSGWLGMRDGPTKLVVDVDTGRTSAFDLVRDPHESDDVAADPARRVDVDAAATLLRRWSRSQRAAVAAFVRSRP